MLVPARATQVKSHARMLNKLESADDHRDKPLPRPKWNVDTVRAGIIVHDAALLAQVYDAIAAHVGIFLRVKNAFAEGAVVNYGYRAILGNLRLESGLTVRRVFGGAHTAKWLALGKARVAKVCVHGRVGATAILPRSVAEAVEVHPPAFDARAEEDLGTHMMEAHLQQR